jgi:sugar (pentulose or hexulose) kinase
MQPERRAVIDVGTNSVKLLLAEDASALKLSAPTHVERFNVWPGQQGRSEQLCEQLWLTEVDDL